MSKFQADLVSEKRVQNGEHNIFINYNKTNNSIEVSGDHISLEVFRKRGIELEKALITAYLSKPSTTILQFTKYPACFPRLFAHPKTKEFKNITKLRSQASLMFATLGFGRNTARRYGEGEAPKGFPVLYPWHVFKGPVRSGTIPMLTEIILQMLEAQNINPMNHGPVGESQSDHDNALNEADKCISDVENEIIVENIEKVNSDNKESNFTKRQKDIKARLASVRPKTPTKYNSEIVVDTLSSPEQTNSKCYCYCANWPCSMCGEVTCDNCIFENSHEKGAEYLICLVCGKNKSKTKNTDGDKQNITKETSKKYSTPDTDNDSSTDYDLTSEPSLKSRVKRKFIQNDGKQMRRSTRFGGLYSTSLRRGPQPPSPQVSQNKRSPSSSINSLPSPDYTQKNKKKHIVEIEPVKEKSKKNKARKVKGKKYSYISESSTESPTNDCN